MNRKTCATIRISLYMFFFRSGRRRRVCLLCKLKKSNGNGIKIFKKKLSSVKEGGLVEYFGIFF